MSRLITTISLFILPVLLVAQSDWKLLPEPFGGNPISLIDIDEGILLSTEFDGLFLSTDEGVTWEPYGSGEVSPFILGVLGDGALWAITDDEGGSFRMVERATKFELGNAGLTGRVIYGTIAENDSAFLVTEDGLFISSDNALNWRKIDLDIGEIQEYATVAVEGDRLILVHDGRVWRSEDLGNTFSEITESIPAAATGAAWTEGGDLLLGTDNGLFRSTGGTAPFSLFALEGLTPLLYGWISEDRDGTFRLSMANGHVYRVSADGQEEARIDIPTRYTYYIHPLESGAILLSDNGTGLWRADDGDSPFELVGIPYANSINGLIVGPGRELIAPIPYGIAVSTDDGESWTYSHVTIEVEEDDGSYEELYAYQALDDGTIIAIGEAGSLVRWLPDGETVVLENVFSVGIRQILQTSENNLMAFGWETSFLSTDLGATWEIVDLAGWDATVDAAGRLWVVEDPASGPPILRYSDDGGVTLNSMNVTELDERYVDRLPEGGILLSERNGRSSIQFISLDNGASWDSVAIPCSESYVDQREVAFGPGLVLTTSCGLYFWNRSAHQWENEPFVLPDDLSAYSVEHTGSHLFVNSRDGLFRIEEESMSVTPRPGPVVGLELAAQMRGDALQVSIGSESSQVIDLRLYSLNGKELVSTSGVRLGVGRTIENLQLPEGVATGRYLLVASTESGGVIGVVCEIAGRE